MVGYHITTVARGNYETRSLCLSVMCAAGSNCCCKRAALMASNFEDTRITSPHFLTIADLKNQRLIGEPLTVTPQPAFTASQLR